MAKAIEQIADGLVRLKDRAELERLREHRSRLLRDYRMRPLEIIRSKTLETCLQDDIEVIDAALSRLSIR